MTGLIPALAGEAHSDVPWSVGKIGERLGCVLHPIHFFVHLTMKELNHFQRMVVGEIHKVHPATLLAKPRVARGGVTKKLGIEGW